MSGYSVDLRERVVQAWEKGHTQAWIAETLQISVSTIKRYLKRYRETGSLVPTQQRREEPRIGDSQRS